MHHACTVFLNPLFRHFLYFLCHDAAIAPSVCMLPGPKTICRKLHYSLSRLKRDVIGYRFTTLKLPASWPQTPIVTASVQDGRSNMAWVCVLKRILSLCSLILTLFSSEIKKTESPSCVALTYHNNITA